MGQETYYQNLKTVTRSQVGSPETTDHRVPGLTILAHPDVRRVGERTVLHGLTSGHDVLLSRGEETVFAQPGGGERRGLADPHMSRSPLKLTPILSGGIRLDLNTTRTRVAAGDGTVIAENRDFTAADVERGIVLVLAGRIALLLHLLDATPREAPAFGLVGESPAITAVRCEIERVADVDAAVLLRGATGTGKELVARGIHRASPRRARPFVAVNLGALLPSFAAVELFGAVKGAYSGADRQRDGCFVRAHGGTLLLDEIDEASPEVQVMLLRTLQDHVVQAVGAETAQELDVRIIAATDADLEAEIEAGRFSAPLLYRLLSGYEIRLPLLADRRDDVGRLLVHFLREELVALGEGWRLEEHGKKAPWLPAGLVARLAECPWPGNVRQLKSVARQLVIANRGEPQLRLTSGIEDLLKPSPATGAAASAGAPASPPSPTALPPPGDALETRSVLRTLLLFDLVDSTRLIDRLGDRRALELMSRHDRATRALLPEYDGYEVDKSDGFLLLFERPADAVGFALEYHEMTRELSEELGVPVAARAGICLGEVFVRHNSPEEIARGAKSLEVEGLSKPAAARLMSLASRRQTLVTRSVFDLVRQVARGDHPLADAAIRWSRHGKYRLKGMETRVEVCEIGIDGTAPFTKPAGARSAERVEEASGGKDRRSEEDDDSAGVL